MEIVYNVLHMKVFSHSIVFFCIMLDQISKRAVQHIGYYKFFHNLHFFPAWNKGVSFSFLSSVNNFTLTACLSIICIYVFKLLLKSTKTLEKIGLSMILGGGISNLIDRLIYKKVFDFILLKYDHWQFAIFNLADACITIGVCLLFIDIIKAPSKKRQKFEK